MGFLKNGILVSGGQILNRALPLIPPGRRSRPMKKRIDLPLLMGEGTGASC